MQVLVSPSFKSRHNMATPVRDELLGNVNTLIMYKEPVLLETLALNSFSFFIVPTGEPKNSISEENIELFHSNDPLSIAQVKCCTSPGQCNFEYPHCKFRIAAEQI